jgi:hypothetical protein
MGPLDAQLHGDTVLNNKHVLEIQTNPPFFKLLTC